LGSTGGCTGGRRCVGSAAANGWVSRYRRVGARRRCVAWLVARSGATAAPRHPGQPLPQAPLLWESGTPRPFPTATPPRPPTRALPTAGRDGAPLRSTGTPARARFFPAPSRPDPAAPHRAPRWCTSARFCNTGSGLGRARGGLGRRYHRGRRGDHRARGGGTVPDGGGRPRSSRCRASVASMVCALTLLPVSYGGVLKYVLMLGNYCKAKSHRAGGDHTVARSLAVAEVAAAQSLHHAAACCVPPYSAVPPPPGSRCMQRYRWCAPRAGAPPPSLYACPRRRGHNRSAPTPLPCRTSGRFCYRLSPQRSSVCVCLRAWVRPRLGPRPPLPPASPPATANHRRCAGEPAPNHHRRGGWIDPSPLDLCPPPAPPRVPTDRLTASSLARGRVVAAATGVDTSSGVDAVGPSHGRRARGGGSF